MSAAKILAGCGALLLLASCGGAPGARPQAANPPLAPTLASTGPEAAAGRTVAPPDLKGFSPAQVAALYGDPDLKRIDPPAEIWQYRSAECVVDLFFYDDQDGARMVYAESRLRHPQHGIMDARCADAAAPLTARMRQTKL
jgi:hypothetical protein